MTIGEWHETASGYRYRETLHGPMVMGSCVDCGDKTLVIQPTGRINACGLAEDVPTSTPRCSSCGRWHYGLPGGINPMVTRLRAAGIPAEVIELLGVH